MVLPKKGFSQHKGLPSLLIKEEQKGVLFKKTIPFVTKSDLKDFKTCRSKICQMCHIDYFEQQALETQQIQGGLSDLPLLTQKQFIKFPTRKILSLYQEERTFLSSETGNQHHKGLVQTNLLNKPYLPLVSPIYFLVTVSQSAAP